jgi:hypothetical protein
VVSDCVRPWTYAFCAKDSRNPGWRAIQRSEIPSRWLIALLSKIFAPRLSSSPRGRAAAMAGSAGAALANGHRMGTDEKNATETAGKAVATG